MSATIAEAELIDKHRAETTLWHLAKTPIADKGRPLAHNRPQLYVMGFNAGGRPDGLWLSRGSSWLQKVAEINSPSLPMCCYIYDVTLMPDADILVIRDEKDFKKFDKKFADYWLNIDYFGLDFTDYLTGETVYLPATRHLNFDSLRRRPGETLRQILINNHIIFDTAAKAQRACKAYKKLGIPIERFKHKDWSAVAASHSGIIFENWSLRQKFQLNYFWYQSLDISSACIWDVSCIKKVELLYSKVSPTTWEKHTN